MARLLRVAAIALLALALQGTVSLPEAVVAADSPAAAAAPAIEIVSAMWGDADNKADVTGKIQELIDTGKAATDFQPTYKNLGDPAPRKAKELTLTFKVAGTTYTQTFKNGAKVNLAALAANPGPPVKVADVRQFKGHTAAVMSVAFSPDGKILASGDSDKTVILWDVATGEILAKLEGSNEKVISLAFSPDGKMLLSGTRNREITEWDLQTKKAVMRHMQLCDVREISFLPDSVHFLSLCGVHLRLWKLGTEDALKIYSSDDHIETLCVTTAGEAITGGLTGELIAWDPMTGKQISKHNRPRANNSTGEVDNRISSNWALPDGNVLVGDSTGLWTWDRKADRITLMAKDLWQVSGITADGKSCFGWGLTKVIWMRQCEPIGTLTSPDAFEGQLALAVSPDNKFTAVAGGGKNHADGSFTPNGHFEIQVNAMGPLQKEMEAARKRDDDNRKNGVKSVNWSEVLPDDAKPIPWE